MSFVATAVVGGAVIGTAGTMYAADKQSDAINSATSAENARLAQLQPFVNAGIEALPTYQANINKQPTYANTLAGLATDPGYQFELQQGLNAVQGSAAARGLLRSGRTIKGLTEYAQGLASQRAADAYTRELNAFNNQQNQLLQLMNAGQSGAGAQSNLGQLALQQGQNSANLGIGMANVGTSALNNLMLARQLQPTTPPATTGGGAGSGAGWWPFGGGGGGMASPRPDPNGPQW